MDEATKPAIEETDTKNGPKYPFADGDFIILGPEIFTAAPGKEGHGVICWKGENYYLPSAMPKAATKLKDFEVGNMVEVLKNGDWLKGSITGKDKVSHHLHVHTDRGPVTIASTHFIRKL